jgi:hypothetical protein
MKSKILLENKLQMMKKKKLKMNQSTLLHWVCPKRKECFQSLT